MGRGGEREEEEEGKEKEEKLHDKVCVTNNALIRKVVDVTHSMHRHTNMHFQLSREKTIHLESRNKRQLSPLSTINHSMPMSNTVHTVHVTGYWPLNDDKKT